MTPKEKAKELVEKMMNVDKDSEFFDGFVMPKFYAQRAALIAVDLLIEDNCINEEIVNGGLRQLYWKEVKQEIEKL